MTDTETQVRAALAALGAAHAAPKTPVPAPALPDARPRGPRRTVTRPAPARGGEGWDRIAARAQHPDIGRYADLMRGAGRVTVRIAKISGMSGRATVQVCETREVLDVETCDLDNRRDVE